MVSKNIESIENDKSIFISKYHKYRKIPIYGWWRYLKYEHFYNIRSVRTWEKMLFLYVNRIIKVFKCIYDILLAIFLIPLAILLPVKLMFDLIILIFKVILPIGIFTEYFKNKNKLG